MEMVKATHWVVRGDLDFTKRIVLQGRRYRLIDTSDFTSARGKYSELLIWSGTCAVCSRKFTFETSRGKFYPTATCELHRGQARSRKRPARK